MALCGVIDLTTKWKFPYQEKIIIMYIKELLWQETVRNLERQLSQTKNSVNVRYSLLLLLFIIITRSIAHFFLKNFKNVSCLNAYSQGEFFET